MTRRHPKPLRQRARSPFVWHRWIGLLCAPLLVLLVITGILLNHAGGLALDQRWVNTAWLLSPYGLKASAPEQGLKLDRHWLTVHQGRLYLDQQRLADDLDGALLAADLDPPLLAVATRQKLQLLTLNGEPVEQLASHELPVSVAALDLDGERLQISDGQRQFVSRDLGLSWQAETTATVAITQAAPLPEPLAAAIAQDAIRDRISWARLLGDLHSGRWFGAAGVWVVDAIALLLCALAFSGPWMWWRQQRARRARHQKSQG